MMKQKILIIGAGASGLSCGSSLFENGFTSTMIAEASEKYGGRISTIFLKDTIDGEEFPFRLEMGAHWIHGVTNSPVYAVAEKHDLLKPQSQWPLNKTMGYKSKQLLDDGSEIPKDISKECRRYYIIFRNEVETFFDLAALPGNFTEASSFEEFIEGRFAEVWAEKGYSSAEVQIRRQVMQQQLKFECGLSGADTMRDVSLQQFGSYKELDDFNPEVGQGYIRVLDKIAESIPEDCIRLNTPVVSINYECINAPSSQNTGLKSATTTGNSSESNEANIKVTFEDGSEELFDHVVFSGSLGVLKDKHDTLFTPPLPASKQAAIASLGIETVDKIFLEFENIDFFPPDVRSIQPCWNHDKEGDCRLCGVCCTCEKEAEWTKKCAHISVARTPKCNMLEVWLTGREADHMETLSDSEVVKHWLHTLRTLLPGATVPPPVRIIRTKWGSNPYTRGSYSYVAVGSTERNIRDLADPICHPVTGKPVILFAGEATHAQYYSTVHGAYLSGERAARSIVDYYEKTTTASHWGIVDCYEKTTTTPRL